MTVDEQTVWKATEQLRHAADLLDKVTAIKALIQTKYDPTACGQGYWETGNFDDTFEMGCEAGAAFTYGEIGAMLGMDLPDMEEIDVG